MTPRGSPSEPLRPGRALAYGLLLGGAWGAAEAGVGILGHLVPSIARRALPILAYSTILHGLLLGFVFVAASLWARLGVACNWHTVRRGRRPVLLGFTAAFVVFSALVRFAPDWFALLPGWNWQIAASLAALFALLVGWGTARLAARPEGWLARPVEFLWRARMAAALGASVLVVAVSATLLECRSAPARTSAADSRLRPPDRGGPSTVVLVLVDTLRADVLSCYGGRSGLTPTIDRLARDGVLFEQAYAPTSWTLPSVATLFTSSPPRRHGVRCAIPMSCARKNRKNLFSLCLCASVVSANLAEQLEFHQKGTETREGSGRIMESLLLVSLVSWW